MTRLTLVLALGAAPGFAQGPAAPPPNTNQPAVPAATPAAAASSSSHISHIVSGPDGRVQGLMLRNGTFVSLSPALAQQMPSNLRHNSSVTVSGPAYSSGSSRTIQAQQLTIAGVSYTDAGAVGGAAGMPPQPVAGAAVPPAGTPGIAPPPPPPGAGAPPPPRGPGAPPPPGAGAPPPPPPPPAGGPVPPPPGPGAVPPPTGAAPAPPAGSNAPAQPAPAGVNPAAGQPAPAAQPAPQTPPSAQN